MDQDQDQDKKQSGPLTFEQQFALAPAPTCEAQEPTEPRESMAPGYIASDGLWSPGTKPPEPVVGKPAPSPKAPPLVDGRGIPPGPYDDGHDRPTAQATTDSVRENIEQAKQRADALENCERMPEEAATICKRTLGVPADGADKAEEEFETEMPPLAAE